VDAAGQLLVDLEDLFDGAVPPVVSERSDVLELQAVFEDPIARVVQRCALLSSLDAHLDDFRAAPALRGRQGHGARSACASSSRRSP
jgi:hypothetical protein